MEKKSINLLQDRGAPPTFWERLYEWMTNTCRVIVIVIELFVLAAFGWRFVLEVRLSKISDDIEVKGDMLKSLSDQEEDEIRLLQRKTGVYKTMWEESSNFTPLIEEVNKDMPLGMERLSVSIGKSRDGRRLSISGEVERDKVSILETKLKDSLSFSDVALADIERMKEGEDLYSFSLVAKIIFSEKRTPLSQDEGTKSTTQ